MNSFVKNVTSRMLSFLLIAIIGLMVFNKGAFTHAHKLADGSVVTHSHPYDKSNDSAPYKSHHHANAELFFLQNIEILFFTLSCLIAFLNAVRPGNPVDYLVSFYKEKPLLYNEERAPPCLIQS